MTPSRGAALRPDAQRNREKVLQAAVVELTADPDVALSAIARRAGVGQGTLYRHFPNREALVLEVYEREVSQVAASAATLLAEHAPDVALRAWMTRLADFAMVKSGLAEAFDRAGRPTGDDSPGYVMVRESIDLLLEANRAAGTIRPDITTGDFLLAIAGIWQMDPRGDWPAQAARLLDLVMAGLRAPAGPAR